MLKHVKRHWNETRGDQHDGWGTSWWYFEVANDGQVVRHLEQYQSGELLHYDLQHDSDTYGGLAKDTLDLSEAAYLYISAEEFEQVWERAIQARCRTSHS
ncbi:hypothetical protein QPK32_00455 [Massilia sp. YIM B02763]|uniref:hypothetical protein n=1 Tax=Massilia sp. YIM B02763 TaxID=3050130 RepID=UPI0025B6922D|nr:hypothetical protein [Massilia sp. YIM B02763]MDN4051553.1 hypothetical protein [Massilia sp. YIM B02763]